MISLCFQRSREIRTGVDSATFPPFQSRCRHGASNQNHILKFPAGWFVQIATADLIRPEIQLLAGSGQILFVTNNPDAAAHQASK